MAAIDGTHATCVLNYIDREVFVGLVYGANNKVNDSTFFMS